MSNETPSTDYFAFAQGLLEQGKTFSEIQQALTERSVPDEDITQVMTHVKDTRYQKHRSIGMPLIAAGVVLCVTGFIVVVVSTHTGTAFNLALYGMTGVGASTIMGGLFVILG